MRRLYPKIGNTLRRLAALQTPNPAFCLGRNGKIQTPCVITNKSGMIIALHSLSNYTVKCTLHSGNWNA